MWISDDIYEIFKKSLPIPCVDLIIKNSVDDILILKRQNEPAKNQWWFPGGRILFGETRNDAVKRKIKQECGISGTIMAELGTFDLFLSFHSFGEGKILSHGISTFFLIKADSDLIQLDNQSSEYQWCDRQKANILITNIELKEILNKAFK